MLIALCVSNVLLVLFIVYLWKRCNHLYEQAGQWKEIAHQHAQQVLFHQKIATDFMTGVLDTNAPN